MRSDFHNQKAFRVEHGDDKVFTSRLSKESSKSNPSFRVYYGDVSSTVPFTWESTPGTPKHKSSENPNIPPLTPPPSYFTKNLNNSSKNHSRSKLLLNNLLRRMSPAKKSGLGSSSLSSSLSSLSSLSWSSSAHSSFSDRIAAVPVRKRRRFSSWGSSFDSKSAEDPRGCFGIRNGYSGLIVKRALLSIVGRRSSA